MTKNIPIGISDYKELISNNYYYVDKTLLIKDIRESGQVVLAPRPRRFGKSLNLSMLRYFFELGETKNDYLFAHTAIWQTQYRDLQGQFPVIFVSFKNIFQTTYEQMLKKFEYTIAAEYERLSYITHGNILQPHEKERFNRIRSEAATLIDLGSSLEFLLSMLHKYHNKKVIILIDEYDVPVQHAFINNFYDTLIPFVKELLTGALKDHTMLEKGVITGNLTLAKSGIFTGLNNLDVFNLTNTRMADRFGFTSQEVDELCAYYGFENIRQEIKKWYNGYTFGKIHGIFNPWSVLKCVSNNGSREMYWANTSDNILLKRLIGRASQSNKSELELVLQDQSVRHTVEESIVFPDLDKRYDLIWSLLLFTGYLTYTTYEIKDGKKECDLIIPNQEIKYLYKELINRIFEESVMGGQSKELLKALIEGNTQVFAQLLQSFVINSMSTFDLPSAEPERSYHLFILGLLVALSDEYVVKSNRESGLGRYDIMLIPKQLQKPGIIIEFKKVWSNKTETIEVASQKALDQILEKKYVQELQEKGVQRIFAYGIAFEGKTLFVQSTVIA